jgi:Concanavalin A-like lectin/glucanases superfamily
MRYAIMSLSSRAWRGSLMIFLTAQASQTTVHAGPEAVARPVACWSFDDDTPVAVRDGSGAVLDRLIGSGTFASGVKGRCLVLDGMTAHVVRKASRVPRITGPFSVETWIVLGAYPLDRAPVVDLHDPDRSGFCFGIDAHGRPGLALRAGDRWQPLTAPGSIPLREWHHIAGVFDPAVGLKLFLDGRMIAEQKAEGAFEPPERLDLLIGRHRFKAKPEGAIRPNSTAEVFDFLD